MIPPPPHSWSSHVIQCQRSAIIHLSVSPSFPVQLNSGHPLPSLTVKSCECVSRWGRSGWPLGGWKLWYSVPGKGLTISHFCPLSKSNHIFILKFLLSLRHHQHQPPHTPSSISTMDQPASHRNPVASLLTLGSWDLNQTMKNHLLNSFRFQYYGPTGEWSKSSPREYLNLLLLLVVWVVELPERGFICYWGYAKRCFCRSVWTDKANERIMATFESSPAAAAAWSACVNMWVALNGRGSVLTTTTILNEEWLVKGEFSGL